MIDQRLLDMVKSFEGCRLAPYRCPANKLTVGYGHQTKSYDTITQEIADWYLMTDLLKSAVQVVNIYDGKLLPYQLAALASFVFNVGIGNFVESTMLKKLRQNDFSGAAEEFDRWVYAGREILPGLVTRRKAEKRLFKTGNHLAE